RSTRIPRGRGVTSKPFKTPRTLAFSASLRLRLSLPHLDQPVSPLPMASQVFHHQLAFLWSDLWIRIRDDDLRFALRDFQQLAIAQWAGDAELRRSRLSRAEELARAAQFEIEFRDLEAVLRAHHRAQSFITLLGHALRVRRHEDAIGPRRATPDAPAQLME